MKQAINKGINEQTLSDYHILEKEFLNNIDKAKNLIEKIKNDIK